MLPFFPLPTSAAERVGCRVLAFAFPCLLAARVDTLARDEVEAEVGEQLQTAAALKTGEGCGRGETLRGKEALECGTSAVDTASVAAAFRSSRHPQSQLQPEAAGCARAILPFRCFSKWIAAVPSI